MDIKQSVFETLAIIAFLFQKNKNKHERLLKVDPRNQPLASAGTAEASEGTLMNAKSKWDIGTPLIFKLQKRFQESNSKYVL